MKQVAGKHVYLLVNLYNPAAYEWAWLNCYVCIYKFYPLGYIIFRNNQ